MGGRNNIDRNNVISIDSRFIQAVKDFDWKLFFSFVYLLGDYDTLYILCVYFVYLSSV